MNGLLFRLALTKAIHYESNLANLNNRIGHKVGERSPLIWDTGISSKGAGRKNKEEVQ